MERLNLQDPEKKENTELLNRILSTLLERQITTDECIEISHATPRTSRLEYLLRILYRNYFKAQALHLDPMILIGCDLTNMQNALYN